MTDRRQPSAPYPRTQPGTSPLAKAHDIADLADKLERLALLVAGNGKAADPNRAGPGAAGAPSADTTTIYLTRRIKRWRMIGGALVALVVAITTVAANLYSYLQGYASERAEEILRTRAEAESAKLLIEQVKSNTDKIEALQKRPAHDVRDLEAKLEELRVLNALQWAYVTDVVDAIQDRRRPPDKSPELLKAEDTVFGHNR